MDSTRTAFVGGLVAGAAIAAYLAYQKGRELSGRGRALAQNLAEGGSDIQSYLLSEGADLRGQLETLAREEVEKSARKAADDYMVNVYGITPQRIERIGIYATALKRIAP